MGDSQGVSGRSFFAPFCRSVHFPAPQLPLLLVVRCPPTCYLLPGAVMVRWAILFFVIALVAALFGFGGIAGDSAWIGQILLFVFLTLGVVSVIRGRRGPSV